ncbi:MAG: 3-hydroxyacyl-CoA dehydrogenase [Roseivirga sp.]|jgi:3-hydroxybutyryl-CoA dehydrogenase|uniref:3-hydroxyacyl-CoA dehydrogenase family protein n=1 Tax=Roseivirga sp. TaxID=1964215 RepID=UPI001B1E5B7F|nr:3-hydroxyacyl-CoA dehydrogenase family protein [Roseivirga sp.]MBO6496280.1 3-hydroxyacyl-CoA dehydrogenase [Roseivirga sp.]
MNILVVGNDAEFKALERKFAGSHSLQHLLSASKIDGFDDIDVVFDFNIADQPEDIEAYLSEEGLNVFLNAPKISLAEMAFYQPEVNCNLYGFNGLPTFIEREILEVSALNNNGALETMCQQLETDFEVVKDRVGMVTPRIIFMIINEAYYTVQEGTATREDIDQGMKLGTNYPFGPFEWAEKIGLDNVYETLEAIYEDTKEERYKICPLLKREYLLLN